MNKVFDFTQHIYRYLKYKNYVAREKVIDEPVSVCYVNTPKAISGTTSIHATNYSRACASIPQGTCAIINCIPQPPQPPASRLIKV